MNIPYQSFALYIGAFTIAYGALFFHSYTKKENVPASNPEKESSFLAADKQISIARYQSSKSVAAPTVSRAHSRAEETEISGFESYTTSITKDKNYQKNHSGAIPTKSSSALNQNGRVDDNAHINTQNDSLSTTLSANRTIAIHNPNTTISKRQLTSTTNPIPGNTADTGTKTSQAADFEETAITDTIETTVKDSVENQSAGNKLTTDVQSSDRQTVSNNNSVSINSDDKQAPVSDNEDNNLVIPDNYTLEPEDTRWATADCPYLLPEGNSEEDAKNMTVTYGCRYRYSCVNRNDGTGSYYCRWQYIQTF